MVRILAFCSYFFDQNHHSMAQKIFKYTNGELTILWKPDTCIHSGICFHGLPEVFDPRRRPWIDPARSDTKTMIEQVKKCPSGALSYFLNEKEVTGK